MDRDAAAGLIGALGLLALLLLGLALIVRGVFSGLRGGPRLTAPVGFGQGALGRTLASLLSFAVAYTFFFERYTAGVLSPETALGTAVLVLTAMVLIPPLETLVSLAALTVFLSDNTAVFGGSALGSFLVLLSIYVPVRWWLGR
ncbi:MAG: hypothetical protein ACRERD_08235 [Candidatus Binatia bacterium]